MTLSNDPTLLALLRGSHIATARVTLTAGTTIYDIPVVSGSVVTDARRSVRRSLSLETVDVDGTLTRNGAAAPLTPFGSNEIRVYRGVINPATGGTIEVLLGVFRITDVELSVGEDGAVMASVQGEDRMNYVSTLRFSQSLEVPAGVAIMSESGTLGAVQRILNNLKVTFPRSLPAATTTINYQWFGADPEEDPSVSIGRLAESVGYELFFNNEGTLTASVVPALTGTPVWNYAQDANNVVLSVRRGWTTDGLSNGVQMTSQDGATTAVYAESFDANASSPTVVTPSFGKRPVRIDNPYVRTSTQAKAACDRLLNAYIGQPITWEQVPNPAMDVRDLVRVQETRLGVDTTVLVDSITMPLTPGDPMSVEGRSVA